MSTHTPGPWLVEPTADAKNDPDLDLPDGCNFWIANDAPAGEVIALLLQTVRGQQEANARLIAAAPELLAFARGVVQEWDESANDSQWTGNMPAYVEAARAAIAKAEGR